jgi:hypothetical protein
VKKYAGAIQDSKSPLFLQVLQELTQEVLFGRDCSILLQELFSTLAERLLASLSRVRLALRTAPLLRRAIVAADGFFELALA